MIPQKSIKDIESGSVDLGRGFVGADFSDPRVKEGMRHMCYYSRFVGVRWANVERGENYVDPAIHAYYRKRDGTIESTIFREGKQSEH